MKANDRETKLELSTVSPGLLLVVLTVDKILFFGNRKAMTAKNTKSRTDLLNCQKDVL